MITRKVFLLLLVLCIGACDSDNPVPEIPHVLVNEQINLTNIQYNRLRQDNGYVYLNGGVRGIIILRKSATQYLAFERNCPYQPANDCAKVEADASGLFFIDPCCTSQFDLNGLVIGGPSMFPLRQYATALQGNFLSISN